MEPKTLAKNISKVLSDKKAVDIRVLEVTDLTVLADFFVLATGTSVTHLKTLADEVEFTLKKQGTPPLRIEGKSGGNWLLLDYGPVVVHLLLRDARDFYSLERLWADARQWNEEEL